MYEQIDHAEAREIINFQISYNKRKIKATWGLAILIISMYLLEEYFGGSQNVSVLVRMGANVAERVKEGEYYRLLSSVFLHAGFMHVFFNTYVLFALGGFFNRILGESKYLVIFFVSGISGSLASVYFGKASVSVGASGAIWGLFGASLALAVFKTGLIPEAIRLRLRRITLINLLINLGISFLPMIDMWAHIGGGLGGFLVSLPIIMRPNSRFAYRTLRYTFGVLAWLLSFLYLASISYGFYRFEPWKDQLKAELTRKDLSDVPFSMALPAHLVMVAGPKNSPENATFSFGDPKIDTLLIEIQFFHENILNHPANKEWLKEQSQQLLAESSVPAKVKKTIFLKETSDGSLLYYQQWPKNEGIVIHNYVFTHNHYAIKLGIIVDAQVTQTTADGLAKKMMMSIKDNAAQQADAP